MRKRMIRGLMMLTAVLAVMTACGQETAIERQREQKAPTEAEVKENTPEVSQEDEKTAAEENDDAVTGNEDMDAPDTEDAENAVLIEDGERTPLGDIDQDGTKEFIVSRSIEDGDSVAFTWDLVFDGKIIYHGSHELPCDFGDCWYMDLDEDGEKEIFAVIYPHVNSMPLAQYVALKKTPAGWQALENTDNAVDKANYSNAFPIRVVKGKEGKLIEISCDGCADSLEYDVTEHYQYIYDTQQGELHLLAQEILFGNKYSAPDTVMGEAAAWGVWELAQGSSNGTDCIIATHGIQGPGGKSDMLGTAEVYFNYNRNGKIRVLQITFTEET